MIRQPIITVMGHVDHGKTTLLDRIRNTAMAAKEAGGITQHIGASEVPLEVIERIAGPLLKKFGSKITIPGLLFIDTPGHEAFTNLRRRGGSVADLAILVVDVSKSFEPQTYEAIEILKEYKTPFIVAANKIDTITGWRVNKTTSFLDSLQKQQPNVANELDSRIYELVGKLSEVGFSSERFDRVHDFQKEIMVLPVSAKTGEGIAELLVYATGLAQRFLEKRLSVETKEPGRGSILEKKEEKGLGTTIDVILYNGTLRTNDNIAFATEKGVGTAKIKALLKPKPLQELRDTASKFYYVDAVAAASGVKISGNGLEEALPGSLVISTATKGYREEIEAELREAFSTDKTGVVLRADSIGSLEAISRLLKGAEVRVSKKGLGNVTKRDILDAFSMRATDPYSAVVLAFNVGTEEDAEPESEATGVKLIKQKIIYKIIEDYKEWVESEKHKEVEKAEKTLTFPAEIKVLPNHCFRVSHPAVFGVDVVAGRIKPSVVLMNENGRIIGKIGEIQDNMVSLQEAKKGASVAISVGDAVFGRSVKDNETLYVHVDDENERLLNSKFSYLLDDEEKRLLVRIAELKKQVYRE